ncbi:unnamed protein product, partial [Laminaria digitata]
YKRCKHSTCLLHASFGFRAGRRDFCMVHQLPEMVNLVVQSKKDKRAAAAAAEAEAAAGTAAVPVPAPVPAKLGAVVSAETKSGSNMQPSAPPPSKRQRCDSSASSTPSRPVARSGARAGRPVAVNPSRMTRTPVVRGSGAPRKERMLWRLQRRPRGLGREPRRGRGWGRGRGGVRDGAGSGGERLLGVQAGGAGKTGAAVVQRRATRKGRCIAGGCDLHASFGFPKGSRDFCAGHHVEGMVNLVYQSAKRGAGGRVGKAKGLGGRSTRTRREGNGDAPAGGGGAAADDDDAATADDDTAAASAVSAAAAAIAAAAAGGDGGGGGAGGDDADDGGDSGGGSGGGGPEEEGLPPTKKSRRKSGVGVGGSGAGGGGGSSVGESGDGSRHRVWEGTRCGVCDRMAKLGCSSGSCFDCCVKSGDPCEAHKRQLERKQREDVLLAMPGAGAGGGGGGGGGGRGVDGGVKGKRLPTGAFKEVSLHSTGETATLWCFKDFVCGKDTQAAMETLTRTQ